jgi:hypothetical protein
MQNYMSAIVVANNEGNESNGVDSSQVNDCDIILKLASCTILYFVLYIAQRLANFLIYERFVDNCMEQFIDVTSIANISVLILINSYGYYIHGRSGELKTLFVALISARAAKKKKLGLAHSSLCSTRLRLLPTIHITCF